VNRTEKEQLVAELREALEASTTVVIATQSGLTVTEASDLRAKVREAGAGYKVTKNTLAKLAIEGTKFEHLADSFTGPTSIAFSEDAVAAAKVIADYAKANDKMSVVAGAMGEQHLDADGVKSLASMPSLDELRGKLVGLLQAPAGKIASVTQAPAAQLARVFSAYGSSN
jgi:large subunit ribosomal protein L10